MRILPILLLLFPLLCKAGEFGAAGQAFIDHMAVSQGFDRDQLVSLFEKVKKLDSVILLMSPSQPSRKPDWASYRARFVDRSRIEGGLRYWRKYARVLEKASATYHVPPEIIVAIIGVETQYGHNTGKFRVLDALSTLAFDYPETENREERMKFFRSELENALVLARTWGVDPLSLQGSYAGAMGLPQFMPGSILRYGIDFDEDGRVDVVHSAADAIGSIANFLAMHGWTKGVQAVVPAKVTTDAWKDYSGGLQARYSVDTLESAGIVPQVSPSFELAGLIDLESRDAPAEFWLGSQNFFAITQYNRSYYYAMSVLDLGRALKSRFEAQSH